MRPLLVSMILALTLAAADLPDLPWADHYDEAVKEAAASNKAVYLLITTPRCRWCHRFLTTTLNQAIVAARLTTLAVPLHVTRGEDDYPEHLHAAMVPMHFFVDPDGQVLIKMPGYWDDENFLSILDDVERKQKRRHRAVRSD